MTTHHTSHELGLTDRDTMPMGHPWTIAVGQAAGQPYNTVFQIRSVRVDSNSCWVSFPQFGIVLPPGLLGHVFNFPYAVQDLEISTVTPTGFTAGTGGVSAVVQAYNRWQTNSPGMSTSAYGGPAPGTAVNATIVGPIGENVEAASVSVTLATDEETIAVAQTGALPAGGNVIGAVTQSGGPWTQNLTQVGGAAIAEGQATMANSLPVAIASNQSAVPENLSQVGGVAFALGDALEAASLPVTLATDTIGVQAAAESWPVLQGLGATNVNSAQVASSGTAGTLAIARATRVGLKIRNLDSTNGVYYGPATVTAANGNFLAAGQETVVTWVGLVQVIAAAGTPTVAIWDEYY